MARPNWSPKHEAFCLVYVQTGDRVKAYRASGFLGKNAANSAGVMLTKEPVKKRIAELQSQAAEKVTDAMAATEDEVLADIRWAMAVAKRGVLVYDKNGNPIRDKETGLIERRPDLAAVLKGAEMKGRTIAMFTDKRENVDPLASKSDAELARVIEAAIAADPSLAEQIVSLPELRKKLDEVVERENDACEGADGGAAAEAQSLSAASKAAGTPSRGLH